MSTNPETTSPAKPKSRLILIVAVVVLLGGGGGAYWMFGRSSPDPEAETEAAEKPTAELATGIVPLDPFVVNLADEDGLSFLRVELGLVVENEEQAKELTESPIDVMRLRSAMLDLLALETAERLVTPEGKAELKKSIVEHIGHSVHDLEIVDVLFSEFLIQ